MEAGALELKRPNLDPIRPSSLSALRQGKRRYPKGTQDILVPSGGRLPHLRDQRPIQTWIELLAKSQAKHSALFYRCAPSRPTEYPLAFKYLVAL